MIPLSRPSLHKSLGALAIWAICSPSLGAPPALPPPISVTVSPAPPAPPAPPAKPLAPRIYVSPDGTTIYLVGMVLEDSFDRFDAVLAKAPQVKTLFLASPGGLTLQARLIAALVRKYKLNTYVEQYCASACTQIFVAGRERIIGREARLGFHQAVAIDRRGEPGKASRTTDRKLTPTTIFGVGGNDTLRLAYEQAGIKQPFIEKALAQDHDGMWFPTQAELTDGNVVTRLAEKPEFPLPEGSIAQADLHALLAKRPVWARAREKLKDAYASGFDEAWRLANSGTELELAISSGRGTIVVGAMGAMARASDSLLDRHLKLYAALSRSERQKGYTICNSALDKQDESPAKDNAEFETAEDLLLVELFDNPPAVPLMTRSEALKIFVKDIIPSVGSLFGRTSSSGGSCKLGFQLIEAIDSLPQKKRIRSYRALLVLPDALDS